MDAGAFAALVAHQLSDRLAQLEASTAKADLLEIEHAQRGFEIDDLSRQKADREEHISLLEARVAEGREELATLQTFATIGCRRLSRPRKISRIQPKSSPSRSSARKSWPITSTKRG